MLAVKTNYLNSLIESFAIVSGIFFRILIGTNVTSFFILIVSAITWITSIYTNTSMISAHMY